MHILYNVYMHFTNWTVFSLAPFRNGNPGCSVVPRVSSARGPMLASAPPPSELAPPPLPHRPTRLAPSGLGVRPPFVKTNPFGPGEKNRQAKKKKKKKKVFNKKKKKGGALESAGPVAYATFPTTVIRHCNVVTYLFAEA